MINIKRIIRNIASVLPRELFRSKEYRIYRQLLDKYYGWNEEDLAKFQDEEFVKVVKHAYNNVEFYKNLYDENNININDIKGVKDIVKLPIINKEIVKKHEEKFLAKNYNVDELNVTYTGGTTSTPMRFYNTKTTNEREKAVFNWIWEKYGYRGPGKDECLILRGNFIDNSNSIYNVDKFNKYVVLNSKNMDEENMEKFVGLIKNRKIKFIQAYPSLIYLVAKYINKNKLNNQVDTVKCVFCSSEKLFNFQRKEIERAFNSKVADYYGHNERTSLFYYNNGYYEEISIYGITEILNNEGLQAKNGERGNIVGTSLNNLSFPLIRYNTYDSVKFLKKSNGRLIIEDIDGRSGDFIITRNGKHYSPTLIEFAIDNIDNFKDIQLIQKNYEFVDVLIVPDTDFNLSDAERFKLELEKITCNEIGFNINIVDKIDKPANSKSRFVVSDIR